MSYAIQTPYVHYTDKSGQPLQNGYVYFGTANLDPQVSPITVYWDAACTIPAQQPVRTLNGYPVWNGTPTNVYATVDNFSSKIYDQNGNLIVYKPVYDFLPYPTLVDASAVSYTPSGAGAVATNVQSKLREMVSAFDFMTAAQIADVRANTALLNVSAAVQAAIDSGKPVFLPCGTYRLDTSLKVENGNVLIGQNGMSAGFAFETTGTYLKPATCAVQTKDYTSQYVGFIMHNVGIIGGTVQVDLGLFHEVDMVNCWFYNASVGGLVIVRGEKHRLERIRFDSAATGNAIFGMSLGRWEESLYGGYSDAFFAPNGAFFDRASIKDVHMQAGGTSTFAYGLKTNILSGTTLSNFVVHGINDARETSVVYTRTRWQQNQFLGCAPDSFGNAGTPAPIMFEFGQVKQSTFMNVSPAFAGNNYYTKGISTALGCFGATFLACSVGGDNATVYGFYFPADVNQYATLLSCEGAYYHSSVSQGIRDQVSQISCHFAYNNGENSATSLVNNQNKYDLMMADANGAAMATGSWGVKFASGGGSYYVPFAVQHDRLLVSGRNWVYDSAAPAAGTWSAGDIVYNVAPISGGYLGWVCTLGGTPGTWKTFGLIS